MKQTAANIGVLLIMIGLLFFLWFMFSASLYKFGNPKLTQTELEIWTFMNWWRWIPPLAGVGGGGWLLHWASRKQ